ncbi:hypothetical protein L3X38_043554 [Prunus dulcis]|uniref:Uncharacterized protein n=1 Tax=Prunus dulcis TaxID=3755 RepID=A0AAD4YN26_PRUDU|nr:hypothetical protein L3X38_043554 [Prunus dulcis]
MKMENKSEGRLKKMHGVNRSTNTYKTPNFSGTPNLEDLNGTSLVEDISLERFSRYGSSNTNYMTTSSLLNQHEKARQNPPKEEMMGRSILEWLFLCDHFQDEAYMKRSNDNKENRSKKKYKHHGG